MGFFSWFSGRGAEAACSVFRQEGWGRSDIEEFVLRDIGEEEEDVGRVRRFFDSRYGLSVDTLTQQKGKVVARYLMLFGQKSCSRALALKEI